MVIVEGPDGAGKSTLVRELRQRFNLLEGERGTEDRKLLYTVTVPDTMRALCAAVDGRQSVRIWDRLYYSELVYADLVGRHGEFSDGLQEHVQAMIEALHCPVILCMPSFETVKTNAAKDEQMDGVNENLRHIYESYWQLYEDGVFPSTTLVYDYTRPEGGGKEQQSHEQVFAEVADYIDLRSLRSWA